jgi:hypothetical protein
MAKADAMFMVSFRQGDCIGRSSYCPNPKGGHAFIWQGDIGKKYDTEFFGCSFLGFLGSQGTHSLESIIAHELLGHGWWHFSAGEAFNQVLAIETENMYHRAQGERARCVTSW